MNRMLNQLLAVFISGQAGHGIIVGTVRDGKFSGADLFGVHFDGRFEGRNLGFAFDITATFPKGGGTVQGVDVDEGYSYRVRGDLPEAFNEGYYEVSTPLGPVNARFSTLRDYSRDASVD